MTEINSRFRNFATAPIQHNQRANQLMGSSLKSQYNFYWPKNPSFIWNPKVYTVLITGHELIIMLRFCEGENIGMSTLRNQSSCAEKY
jgi:hypothetical protein